MDDFFSDLTPGGSDTTPHDCSATSSGGRCAAVAAEILEKDRYLTWAEREFLQSVVDGHEFDIARMRVIAANSGMPV